MMKRIFAVCLGLILGGTVAVTRAHAAVFDVRTYGATGDGKTLDTDAINKAIDAAHAAGGGTVNFPAGTYLSYSIHLKSNIALYLDHGATILAADSPTNGSRRVRSARDQCVGQVPGFRPQPLAQQPDLGRESGKRFDPRPGADLRHRIEPGTAPAFGAAAAAPAGPMPSPDGRRNQCRSKSARRIRRIWRVRRADQPDLSQPARHPGRGRRQQVHRAQELPQRHPPRLLHPARRPFRHPRHRRGQPHDRQPQDRHQPRRHRHRLLPERPRLQLQREFAVGRRHLPKSSYALGYLRPCENVTISDCYVTGGYEEGTLLDGTYNGSAPRPGSATPAASSSAPNPTAASRTSPSPIAFSTTAAAWRWKAWTAPSSRT